MPTDDLERPGRKRPSPTRSPHQQINLRLKPALAEALRRYVESIEPATTITAVIEMLLRQHLTRLGRWPPKPQEGG